MFKALVCLALFCATDLLKTLAAKSLARTFHKEAHFAKMQDALEKVLGLAHASCVHNMLYCHVRLMQALRAHTQCGMAAKHTQEPPML